MQKIEFGSTGLVIEKNGFGCLPIQRISETEAVKLLHKACDGGINFFDTARAYSDSEQKVGAAFSGMRDRIVLATKTGAQTAEGFWRDLETSLRTLKTDYIDIYQFHNPAFCPKPGGEDGLYDAALVRQLRTLADALQKLIQLALPLHAPDGHHIFLHRHPGRRGQAVAEQAAGHALHRDKAHAVRAAALDQCELLFPGKIAERELQRGV